jgi:hypothetical protein
MRKLDGYEVVELQGRASSLKGTIQGFFCISTSWWNFRFVRRRKLLNHPRIWLASLFSKWNYDRPSQLETIGSFETGSTGKLECAYGRETCTTWRIPGSFATVKTDSPK